jgi:A/G-specific adenine glycosylase
LNGRVGDLPFKEKKVKVNNRYFHYLVIADPKRNILVNKRKENDIWKGLYDFVLIEKEKEMKAGALLQSKEFRRNTGENPDVLFVSKTYKHVLSHQHLFTRFYVVKARKKHRVNGTGVNIDSLTKFAFPRLIEKFLNDCNLSELL